MKTVIPQGQNTVILNIRGICVLTKLVSRRYPNGVHSQLQHGDRKTMVAGVDVWLNTPLPPWEASGTSGMKATFNGVPNLSVLDGWWVEGCIEGITGWAIGNGEPRENDAAFLYEKLEKVVLPLYYDHRAGWVKVMKGAIAKNASFFNSHRMMRRYASDAYVR